MALITPDQLPVASALQSTDIFIVQQGSVVAQVNFPTLLSAIWTTITSYLNARLASEYADVTADLSALSTLVNSKAAGNHTHTKASIGLGDVQNIAPLDMPVSTALQIALATKLPAGGSAVSIAVGNVNNEPEW